MALRVNCSASAEQVELLLEFLQEHRDLARGFMRGPEARVRSKLLWAEITKKLNSLGGAVKNVTQWQKVWSDRKHTVKKLSAQLRQAASRTGGGPAISRSLTETEERVLNIMGEGFGLPQTSVRIPLILNDENVDPNPQPTEVHVDGVVDSWDDDQEITIPALDQEHLYCEPPSGPRVTESTIGDSGNYLPDNPGPSSQARRLRWRSQHRQRDLRGQLLESERNKLSALVGIRTEMASVRTELSTMNQNITALVEELRKTNRAAYSNK